MKASKILFLLHILHSVQSKNSKSIVSYAIKEILSDFFLKNSLKVDFINFDFGSGKSESLMNTIIKSFCYPLPLRVSKRSNSRLQKTRLNSSSILFFDSSKTFNEISKNLVWQSDSTKRHQHLVYIPHATIADLEHIRDGFLIDSVNFLMNETESSIELVTAYMFNRFKCKSNVFVTVNRFERSIMRWTRTTFYPNKYRHLYGCSLTVVQNSTDASNVTPFQVLKAFAIFSHFNIRFENLFAVRKPLLNISEIDLFSDPRTLSLSYNETVAGYPYYIDKWAFYIPPGDPYSPLEKMFLPLQFEVWIATLITLLIGILSIKLIGVSSLRIQTFVFGNNIRTPIVNLFAIFLCGSQSKMPTRNFARFLLIIFILWCLIMRTCYQSELFKYLQSDMRKPVPKTISEMIARNFTFYDSGFLMNSINQVAESQSMPK